MSISSLPVVIIGAGPVGLAAAAHVLARGYTPLVLEAGDQVGAGMRQWAHVRMFSPWEYNVDKTAAALLLQEGWQTPDPTQFPTGGEVVTRYLEPLAATAALSSHIQLRSRVTAVTKVKLDRMKNAGRNEAAFAVRYLDGGEEKEVLAQAVVDASGTISTPNPIGAAGIPALGERAIRHRVAYGIPDVLGTQRARYAGRRILVVGSGHSAFNVLADLARLRQEAPETRIEWVVRRASLSRVLGGGENDQLKERGRLGMRIAKLVENGDIRVHLQASIDRIVDSEEGLIGWTGTAPLPAVDEIVASTGFRPDLGFLDEVRLDIDAGTQSPTALAPLIDPNLHSCGSVRPHGAAELQHPDANLYIVGMKSYGRAPTFLLVTGYEQVRSVAAAIAGDWETARRVELVLPETGVCSTQFTDEESPAMTNGCGATPPAESETCCVAAGQAKADGPTGCGSGPIEVAVSAAPADNKACCAPARA